MPYEKLTKKQWRDIPYISLRKNLTLSMNKAFVKRHRLETKGFYEAYLDFEKMSLKIDFQESMIDKQETYEVYLDNRGKKDKRYLLGCLMKMEGNILKSMGKSQLLKWSKVQDTASTFIIKLPDELNNESEFYK